MPESEKENNTTFDKIHNDKESICDIPLCDSKEINPIDESRYSPSQSILSIRKSEEFIGNGEHSTAIDESIDDDWDTRCQDSEMQGL